MNGSYSIFFSSVSIRKHHTWLVGIFIVFLLISPGITILNAQLLSDSTDSQRFIILFDTPSLLASWAEWKNKTDSKQILSLEKPTNDLKELINTFTESQEARRQTILSYTATDPSLQITSMLSWAINGCIIETQDLAIINILKKLPNVKDILPDEKRIVIQSQESQNQNDSTDKTIQESLIFQNATGKNVTIAIFDTGVNYTHPALQANYLGGYDFVNNDSDPFDDHGHGTHCAGIALGHSLNTTVWDGGIAPDAMFYSYKVMDKDGVGSLSSFLQAFDYALDPNQDGDPSDHVDIISISAGDPEGTSDDLLSQAANNAVQSGICVIAAAGNSGPEKATISSPGIAEYVVAVGAATDAGEIASFSSRGSSTYGRIKPDVVAPGVNIMSTWLDGGYRMLSGTSMATPYVAGYCARILEKHPTWTPLEVTMALRLQTTHLEYDLTTQGYGFLNAQTAIHFNNSPPVVWIHNVSSNSLDSLKFNGFVQGFDTLSCQFSIKPKDSTGEWTLLKTISVENQQGELCSIDQSHYPPGTYLIRLTATLESMESIDYFYITIDEQENQSEILVYYPSNVQESTKFSVQIHTSKSTPTISILAIPFKPPQIRIGNDIQFKAPAILRDGIQSIEGKLLVFTTGFGTHSITKKTITIYNTDQR